MKVVNSTNDVKISLLDKINLIDRLNKRKTIGETNN
jgi:hypothetical protein